LGQIYTKKSDFGDIGGCKSTFYEVTS